MAHERFRDPRTLVAGWQNQSVLSQMADLSPEVQLLSLVDDTLFDRPAPSAWRGTAEPQNNTVK